VRARRVLRAEGVIMAKKYYWTRGEEAKLLELWRKGIRSFDVLAKELGRTPGAVQKKVERLSLSSALQTTTTVSLSEDLLTHEQCVRNVVYCSKCIEHKMY